MCSDESLASTLLVVVRAGPPLPVAPSRRTTPLRLPRPPTWLSHDRQHPDALPGRPDVKSWARHCLVAPKNGTAAVYKVIDASVGHCSGARCIPAVGRRLSILPPAGASPLITRDF